MYFGLGAGLFALSVMLWIKNRFILGDDKLKESRLIGSDERIQAISSRAFHAAAIVMIAAMYGIALIGGFFYPVLVKVLAFLIGIFLLVYVIVYRIYAKWI